MGWYDRKCAAPSINILENPSDEEVFLTMLIIYLVLFYFFKFVFLDHANREGVGPAMSLGIIYWGEIWFHLLTKSTNQSVRRLPRKNNLVMLI